MASPGYQRPPANAAAVGAAELDPAVKATEMWQEPMSLL